MYTNIIIRVFIKISYTYVHKSIGEWPQLKVPMQDFKNSLLSYLSRLMKSIEEEIQLSNDYRDTTRGWTLEQLQDLLQVNVVSIFFHTY